VLAPNHAAGQVARVWHQAAGHRAKRGVPRAGTVLEPKGHRAKRGVSGVGTVLEPKGHRAKRGVSGVGNVLEDCIEPKGVCPGLALL